MTRSFYDTLESGRTDGLLRSSLLLYIESIKKNCVDCKKIKYVLISLIGFERKFLVIGSEI